jgi:hypothetical protein
MADLISRLVGRQAIDKFCHSNACGLDISTEYRAAAEICLPNYLSHLTIVLKGPFHLLSLQLKVLPRLCGVDWPLHTETVHICLAPLDNAIKGVS